MQGKGEKKMSENFAFPIPNNVLEPYIKVAVFSAIESAEISKMLVDGLIGSLRTSWNIKIMLNPHDY